RLLGITAEAETTLLGQVAAVAQVLIIITLIGLALSLLKLGYENLQTVRGSGEAVAADGGTEDD
ncbi:MAG: carbon starvation protein A, partial [Halalkalicoccus sp.]|nr:carbon starvation protein A [Halalkalicoccus sp.]